MRKNLTGLVLAALLLGGTTPAESADITNFQTLLPPFSGNSTALNAKQQTQLRQTLGKYKDATSITCTGLRLATASKAEQTRTKNRAAAVCKFAKQQNPQLTIATLTKTTSQRTSAGKVQITIKTAEGETSNSYANFKNMCDIDFANDPRWSANDRAMRNYGFCVRPSRIVESTMPATAPKTAITQRSSLLNPQQCKIENGPQSRMLIGFPRSNQPWYKLNPGPNTVYQIVPIYSSDAPKGSKTPYEEYGHYFDFLEQWTKYNADNGSKVEIRVPKEYLVFPKPIAPYDIYHGNDAPSSLQFRQDVITAVDPKIDFSGVDYIIILVPANTPEKVMGQNGFQRVNTAEARDLHIIAFSGQRFETPNITQASSMLGWLHALYHPGANLDDHYGKSGDIHGANEIGMGNFGLMTRVQTDLLAFEKWVMKFISDDQVRCLDKSQTTTSWLAPTQVKTTKEKLAVIPTGPHTAIILESWRATGLNYKLPKQTEGVLVYTIDTNESRHGYGYEVVTNRRSNYRDLPHFLLADSPLKLNESVTVQGVTITVKETGKWGDVIEVKPAN